MRVEHLTSFSNDIALRDTSIIEPATYQLLRPCIVKGRNVAIPRTSFELKTTFVPEVQAAAFDMIHQGQIFVTNYCCFGPRGRAEALGQVAELLKVTQVLRAANGEPVEPKTDQFLYSIVLPAAITAPMLLMTAGEIEFYIYDTIRRFGYAEK